MKKISAFVILFAIILFGCGPVAPSPSLLPENTVTPVPTFTPEPTQIVMPTSTPFLDVSKITTLSTFNAITSVTSPENVTDVWSVGNDGVIVAYRPSKGQTSFFHMEAPEHADWYDIDFISPDDGWIVGGGDLILHWDGERWEVSKPATNDQWSQFYSYALYSVAFSEANDGWAAGCVGSEGGEQILIYHWDGNTWSKVVLPEELLLWVCIHDITALSPTNVWMVGTGWNGEEYGVALQWNGDRWEQFSEGESFTNHSVSALFPDDIWGITDHSNVWHWDGNKWSEIARLESVNIIYVRKHNDIYAVGDKIWHWNGSTWTNIVLPNNIYPIDPNIIDLVEIPDGRSSDLWLLDSSGIIYNLELYWLDFGTKARDETKLLGAESTFGNE